MKSKFYFNDLAKILEMKPRHGQKTHQSDGSGKRPGILVKRQHVHVWPARNRETGWR